LSRENDPARAPSGADNLAANAEKTVAGDLHGGTMRAGACAVKGRTRAEHHAQGRGSCGAEDTEAGKTTTATKGALVRGRRLALSKFASLFIILSRSPGMLTPDQP